jgi:hypothetical protein
MPSLALIIFCNSYGSPFLLSFFMTCPTKNITGPSFPDSLILSTVALFEPNTSSMTESKPVEEESLLVAMRSFYCAIVRGSLVSPSIILKANSLAFRRESWPEVTRSSS